MTLFNLSHFQLLSHESNILPVHLQYFRVHSHILRRQLRTFVWLGVNPSERLQLFQVIMLWERGRQIHLLMVTPLWHHHDASNLLHLPSVCLGPLLKC